MAQELLPNTHSKEFNDAVGLAYKGEALYAYIVTLETDIQQAENISAIGRQAIQSEKLLIESQRNQYLDTAARLLKRDDEKTKIENSSLEERVEIAKKKLAIQYANYEIDGHKITEADFGLVEIKDEEGNVRLREVVLISETGLKPRFFNDDSYRWPRIALNSRGL